MNRGVILIVVAIIVIAFGFPFASVYITRYRAEGALQEEMRLIKRPMLSPFEHAAKKVIMDHDLPIDMEDREQYVVDFDLEKRYLYATFYYVEEVSIYFDVRYVQLEINVGREWK